MSRAEWILGGLLVVLLLVVAGMALLLWFQPDLSSPPAAAGQAAPVGPTPAYEGQTALVAATAARRQALAWQEDAKLFKATATWRQGATGGEISGGETAWSFTYYSPSQVAIATMTVVDNKVGPLTEKTIANPLSPLEVSGWHVDSPEAVRALLGEGGEAFLNHEGVTTLIMALTTVNSSGRIEWFISLLGEQSGNSFTMRLDATSGEVLEVIQSP